MILNKNLNKYVENIMKYYKMTNKLYLNLCLQIKTLFNK